MNFRRLLLAFSIMFPSLLLPAIICAQIGTGTISGCATDFGGAVLQGARVELQPRGTPTVTGVQGEFTIPDLPPGKYVLTVSYVGFAPFSANVVVAAGQVAHLDAALKIASTREEVRVYAERLHGEADAVNRERTSDNILQVLPVEVITSLPNTNVADALGRLPSVTLERDEGEGKFVQIRGTEPRLSNVTINGVNVASPLSDVRQVKLDIVPADLVESVEINKTLSANQDADAIGGSVNLVTKTPGEHPTLYLNGIGGYTPILGGRALSEVDGTIGNRFGANKRLGVIFGGSYDWNGRGIDDIEPSADVFNGQPVVPAIDLREYRYSRRRWGFAGGLDYKLGDISGLYLRGLYSHFDNFGDRWVYSPEINTFIAPNQGDTDGDVSFNTQIRRPTETIGSLSAGGKHVFARSWLAYDLSVSRSSEVNGDPRANFGPIDDTSPLNHVQFNVDTSNPSRPKFIVRNGVNIYDPSLYFLKSLTQVSEARTAQLNLQGTVSIARNYTFAGHFGTFEFGAKVRNAHKYNDADERVFTPIDPSSLPMTSFLDTFHNSDYYDNSYTLGPLANFGKVQSFFNNNPGAFEFDSNDSHQNIDPNNYDLNERISAGYLMNTLNFGRVRVQTGLRFENTSEDVLGYQIQLDTDGNYIPGSTTPLRKTGSYLDALPSVQLRFGIDQNTAVRVVYGRGIARPNFVDLTPFMVQDDSANKVSVGNPNLKATHSNNFDLLFEKYLEPLGVIQAGVFYKDLSDPVYIVDSLVASGKFAGFTQEQPVNGSSAHLTGVEIAYQQRLSFLPGKLSSLGFAGNYSYTTSRAANVPNRSDRPALLRQAPNTWNISPTYDRGRVSVRVGISHNDANIFQYNFQDGAPLGTKGPLGDVYLYAHTQVDAQGSFRMYRGLQLIVSGLNLTNEVFGFYQGSPQFPIQREYYKPTYSFGLRYTLSNERR